VGTHPLDFVKRNCAVYFLAIFGVISLALATDASNGNLWEVDRFETVHLSSDASLFSLTSDADGCLWLATESGLLCFDGRKTRLFDSFFLGSQAGSSVRLSRDVDGRVWMRDEIGQVFFQSQRRWFAWTDAQLLGSSVQILSRTETGEMLLVGEKGFVISDKSGSEFQELSDHITGARLKAVYIMKDGTQWFVEGHRVLMKKKNSEVRHVLDMDREVEASCMGVSGDLFVATTGQIVRVEADGHAQENWVEGSWREEVTCMMVDSASRGVWLGTQGDGLWHISAERREAVRCQLDIDPLFVTALVPGVDNTICLSTLGSGLLRVRQTVLPSAYFPEHLSDAVWTMDRDGCFWAAGNSELWRKDPMDDVFTRCEADKLKSPRLWVLDENGSSVLLGDDGVVGPVNAGNMLGTWEWPVGHAKLGRVLAGCFGKEGVLWVSRESGLIRLSENKNELEAIWTLAPCQDSEVTCTENSVWMLRDGAVFLVRGSEAPVQLNHSVLQNGLTFLGRIPPVVFALHPDIGVGILNESQWLPLSLDVGDALPKPMSGLRVAENGVLWLTGSDEFFSVSASWAIEGKVDGRYCPVARFSAGRTPSHWGIGGARDSLLWWTIGQHLWWVDSEKVSEREVVRISVDRIHVNGLEKNIEHNQEIVIHSDDLMQVQLRVPRLVLPDKSSVMYRVVGSEIGWQPLTSHGDHVLLGALAPGKYQLETCVNAANGRWQEAQFQLAFQVRGDSTRWPLLLLGLIILLAVVVGLVWSRRFKYQSQPKAEMTIDGAVGKYKTSGLNPERAGEIKKQLLTKMETERPYMKASLTLRRLADQMGVHYNHLSQVINDNLGQSAKDFINRYRVEAAAVRLSDPKDRHSIMDIAYDCGFYSKSVFNMAFKKVYGKTPSEYRAQQKGAIE